MEHTFESIRRHNKPFIFASTQMSSMTDSAYGVLKLIGEYYTSSLNGLTIKLWNVYGIEEQDEKSHVITDFIKKAHKENVIQMITDGEEKRQFLHAIDCSRCLLSLMKAYDVIPRSEKLHITSFEWTKIMDIASHVAKFFPGTRILAGDKKDSVQNGVRNEPSEFILNYWKPDISIQQGIKMVIQELNLR
jgi:nucleoside-diphosphate-sugar epimerase